MSLTTTITSLLTQAQHKPDQIFEIRLKRGLLLGVKWNRQYTTLRLQRDAGASPSLAEWNTVIDFWPHPLPANVEGPRIQNNGRSLVGRWPSPERIEQITLMENIDDAQSATAY